MNLVQTMLKNISAGELQRLSIDVMKIFKPEYNDYIHSGGCEGGNRTRKGIPDIFCKDKNGKEVYIQATANSAKGKMFEDTKKA